MVYSLSKYLLTISIPSSISSKIGIETITIGGEGSYMSQITVSNNSPQWKINADVLGGHIFNKSLDRSGACKVTLSQLSEYAERFRTVMNILYSNEIEDTLTLVITDLTGEKVCTLNSCVIEKIPDLDLQAEAQNQDWNFLVGKITYN